jgi:hypothetical protein
VPCCTNEQTTVVAEVCRPPRLRRRQQGLDIILECIVCIALGRQHHIDSTLGVLLTIQFGKSSGIVKGTPERVLLRRKLAEHIQSQPTRPPVVASGASSGCIAEGCALAEGGLESGERRLVPSAHQEVSLVDAGIGTLGRNERQEPDQHGPDGGRHGRKSRKSRKSVEETTSCGRSRR